jgi:3-oxoacyl-[acyl-carrier protein] reductase
MDLGLRGKRALVLGATGGLGFAVAMALAREGADIVASGRNPDRLADVESRLGGAAEGRVTSAACDLAKEADVDALADRALAAFGGIDILVNNTGGPPPGPVSAVAPETWRIHFQSMVLSVIRLTGRLLPGMRERRWGRILTSTTSGVVQPSPELGISNTLRASLVTWSKTLANEVAAEGVTVNVIVPGRIHTARVDALDRLAAERSGRPLAEVQADRRRAIPMGRYGEPEEYGAVAAFLVSERASYITGSMVRVDGGYIRSV